MNHSNADMTPLVGIMDAFTDGSIKVSEVSTIVLCLDGNVKVLKCQQQQFSSVNDYGQQMARA
jgi:hypothetical protein